MKLSTDFKKGTLLQFKWYENWRDEFANPDNFTVMEGIVEASPDFMNCIIVYNGHENRLYTVRNEYVLKVF